MAKLDNDARARLREAHGDVYFLSTPKLRDEDFAFKACSPEHFDAFLATVNSNDRATKVQAHRQLARDLLVYPEAASFDEMSKKLPGLAHTFGNKLAELAGLDADIVVGKG